MTEDQISKFKAAAHLSAYIIGTNVASMHDGRLSNYLRMHDKQGFYQKAFQDLRAVVDFLVEFGAPETLACRSVAFMIDHYSREILPPSSTAVLFDSSLLRQLAKRTMGFWLYRIVCDMIKNGTSLINCENHQSFCEEVTSTFRREVLAKKARFGKRQLQVDWDLIDVHQFCTILRVFCNMGIFTTEKNGYALHPFTLENWGVGEPEANPIKYFSMSDLEPVHEPFHGLTRSQVVRIAAKWEQSYDEYQEEPETPLDLKYKWASDRIAVPCFWRIVPRRTTKTKVLGWYVKSIRIAMELFTIIDQGIIVPVETIPTPIFIGDGHTGGAADTDSVCRNDTESSMSRADIEPMDLDCDEGESTTALYDGKVARASHDASPDNTPSNDAAHFASTRVVPAGTIPNNVDRRGIGSNVVVPHEEVSGHDADCSIVIDLTNEESSGHQGVSEHFHITTTIKIHSTRGRKHSLRYSSRFLKAPKRLSTG